MTSQDAAPATEHVTFAGYRIPVFEDMYGGEIEQLETLTQRAARGELTDYRLDLECFMVCARFRVPEYRRITAEDFAQLKMSAKTRQSLRQKVMVLLAPFAAMQHELSKEKGLELLKQLEPEKMMDAIQQTEVTLAQMKMMYQEVIGRRSAGASSPATA